MSYHVYQTSRGSRVFSDQELASLRSTAHETMTPLSGPFDDEQKAQAFLQGFEQKILADLDKKTTDQLLELRGRKANLQFGWFVARLVYILWLGCSFLLILIGVTLLLIKILPPEGSIADLSRHPYVFIMIAFGI